LKGTLEFIYLLVYYFFFVMILLYWPITKSFESLKTPQYRSIHSTHINIKVLIFSHLYRFQEFNIWNKMRCYWKHVGYLWLWNLMGTFILYVLPTIFLFSLILMGLCDVGPIGIIFKALKDITFQKTYSSF